MFKECATDEILKMINEATGELARRENKERYDIEITKFVNSKRVEGLTWSANNLDELVADIDKKIERMRPIEVSDEVKEMLQKLSSKKEQL